MKELTPEQESHIGDDVYHEKKIIEGLLKETKYKVIPISPDRFDQIVKGIGRRKLGKTIIKVKGAIT